MKKLMALCVVALFASCASVDDYLEDVTLDRADAQKVATAAAAAVATDDLDENGKVNGLAEWEAFMRALIANMR